MSHSNNIEQNSNDILDLIIVGGGINGAGIAADAAGRGLSVGIYDIHDFASATSSASSKLIHGGLRYLEHYEFRLVAEALTEREVLLKKAAHIAKPMRFRLPHRPFLRPAWMIRAGLFLYDNLGKRTTLGGSHTVKLDAGNVTKAEMKTGFEYSDCWVDDARLVILNIMQAKEYGAEVKNYCAVEKAERIGDIWQVTLRDIQTNETIVRQCKALVNAAGPWVKSFITDKLEQASPYGIRLIKGSHIIVPKIHDEPQAYILQNEDNRIVFVIPYMEKYSLIGTTDVEYSGDPREICIEEDEIHYLIDIVNKHFVTQLQRDDVVGSYSGVRPLCDDESDSPQAITRDYTISLEQSHDEAPLLSIFGGKLTTYRKLAEASLKQLSPFFPEMKPEWTKESYLPGAENYQLPSQLSQLQASCPFLTEATLERYCRQYGTRANLMLQDAQSISALGHHFGAGLYQLEIDYLVGHEFATTAEDILWRRTKLGLELSEEEVKAVQQYLAGPSNSSNADETLAVSIESTEYA